MSDYRPTTDFSAKDSLPSGDAGKIIKGSDFDTEFAAIQTAVASKADTSAVAAAYQPLDATLAALAGLGATAGLVEQTGADTFTKRAIGTASGDIPAVGTSSATEALAGLVELSTTAELRTGTDTARAITPAGLRAEAVVSGTAAPASGTAVDFTGIPAWAKKITVMLKGVSTNGTSGVMVQLGDSGGPENTGYTGGSSAFVAPSTVATTANSSGFLVASDVVAAGSMDCVIQINLLDSASNTWSLYAEAFRNDAADVGVFGVGTKALTATLAQVTVTMVNGTDTFDAGTINILYE